MKLRNPVILMMLILGGLFATSVMASVAPQNIGFKDSEFSSLKRAQCEGCHGKSLADRHHATAAATSGKCNTCHSVNKTPGKLGVSLEHNCTVCHKTSPHHQTAAAKNKQCNTCHSTQGLSAYSTAVPKYKTSKITPKRSSCKSCHAAGTVNGVKVASMKQTHHVAVSAGCDTCHEADKTSQNIRSCERCHSVDALHAVGAHLESSACGRCHATSAWSGQ